MSLTNGRHGNAMYAASFTKNSHGLIVVVVDAVVVVVVAADDDNNDAAYSRLR